MIGESSPVAGTSGAPRSSCLPTITGRPPAERLGGTLAAVAHGVAHGAAILRVHDVAAVADFLAVLRVMEGADPMPAFDEDDERLKWIPAEADEPRS